MAALTCIGLSDISLPEVLKRTRDSSEEVRTKFGRRCGFAPSLTSLHLAVSRFACWPTK